MLKNKLLLKAMENIEQGAEDPAQFRRLLKAGMKVIYSQKTFPELTKELHKSKDPAGEVAKAMVSVLVLIQHRARGTIEVPALLRAGMALTLDALDFAEQVGVIKVDARTLDHATEEYIETLLPALGITTERLNEVLGQVKQVMADPQKMAAYKQSLRGAK